MSTTTPPAIGLLELSSIAKGFSCVDRMLKKAPADLFWAKPISSGKFIILITGDVASVEEALQEGVRFSEHHRVDHTYIPGVHEQILPAIQEKCQKDLEMASSAIIETVTVASAVEALDYALKTAQVTVSELKLGTGIGGKAYFVIYGELSHIEASVEAAEKCLNTKLVHREIIPRPFMEIGVRAEA